MSPRRSGRSRRSWGSPRLSRYASGCDRQRSTVVFVLARPAMRSLRSRRFRILDEASYIEDHKVEFGVEPICRVLSQHGIKIAPSTYYEARSRRPSRQRLRDAELVAVMVAERERQKLIARFGARKMWLHLRGRGHDVARCTVERLYREQGWVGALRLKKIRTTVPDESAERPTDLVDRQFWASRPNQLWVADFTYVATWAGTVYVAFVFDVFSRRIVGWRAATRMTTGGCQMVCVSGRS